MQKITIFLISFNALHNFAHPFGLSIWNVPQNEEKKNPNRKEQINYSLALPVSHQHTHSCGLFLIVCICADIVFFSFGCVRSFWGRRPKTIRNWGFEERVMLCERGAYCCFGWRCCCWSNEKRQMRNISVYKIAFDSMLWISKSWFLSLTLHFQPWEWSKLKNERHEFVILLFFLLYICRAYIYRMHTYEQQAALAMATLNIGWISFQIDIHVFVLNAIIFNVAVCCWWLFCPDSKITVWMAI